MQMTMFTADCTGQAANCSYSNRRVVTTPEEMQEAVRFDHVCAEYKGNYRSIGNFARSDVVVMDIDNDHTEDQEEWVDKKEDGFGSGVIAQGSRNNTMSRFASRILKRYGDTEKAHVVFMEHARKCDPPLPEAELNTIWNSAVKFFNKNIWPYCRLYDTITII